MSARFEELDRRLTPIGEISVRRRLEPTLQVDVYEVKLGDEFLMSSLFTESEVQLARLGLAELCGAPGSALRAPPTRTERTHPTPADRCRRPAPDRHVHVREHDPGGQSVVVDALHPAITAPLGDVVTRRLSLRRLEPDDLDELAAVFADREVWRFEYGRGMTRCETEAFLDRQTTPWTNCGFGGCAVRERAHPDLIGVVGLSVPMVSHELLPAVTVGWRLAPATWRRGYATEAATAVLDQAFTTMGLDRVGCVTDAGNRRSIAVAERLGMSVITEASVPNDDGRRVVTALLLQIDRNHWLPARNGRSERT